MADFEDRVSAPNVCWLAQPYSGDQDYDTEYLGYKHLPSNPVVNLTASFETDAETETFMDWWRDDLVRGTKIMVVEMTLFGKYGTYGLKQIKALRHTTTRPQSKISFSAEIVFSEDIQNEPPKALDAEVWLERDSKDNFIILQGYDTDGHNLTFSIEVPPAHIPNNGLVGTPPNMLYTPLPGYEGDDCFSFKVIDKYGATSTGVVVIHVAQGVKPAFTAEYTIDMGAFPEGIRMGGNYWWNDGVGDWKRGAGGYLKPNTTANPSNNKIRISSNDNFVDDRDVAGVLGLEITTWGERTNFNKFVSLPYCSVFSVGGAAGVCKAENVHEMFKNFKGDSVPLFDTSKVKDWSGFLAYSTPLSIASFDMSSGLDFTSAFEGTNINIVPPLNTEKGEIFKNMFKDSTTVCLGGIDTRKALVTTGMFDGSSIGNVGITTNPTSAEATGIEGKMLWTSSATCGVEPDGITQISAGTCDISTIGGKCKSRATYKAHYKAGTEGQPTNITYQWFVDSPSVIISSNGDTAIIESGDSSVDMDVTLSCTLIDNVTNKAVNTGVYKFTHKRTTSYATLDLPVSSGSINLTSWIKSQTSKTEVVVTNNRVTSNIQVGDFSGLTNVKFINNGEIQSGFFEIANYTAYALDVSMTPAGKFQLINNGWIRGHGGRGGTGANGANDTYTAWSAPFDSHFSFVSCYGTAAGEYWMGTFTEGNGTKRTTVVINGVIKIYAGTLSDWFVPDGSPSTTQMRLGTYIKTVQCSYSTKLYRAQYRNLETHTRIGGAGGKGGVGQGYGRPNEYGEVGAPSNPTGGNSGEQGGRGGTWGVTGNTGAGVGGTVGKPGGGAIKGTGNLKSGSKIGNVNGGNAT